MIAEDSQGHMVKVVQQTRKAYYPHTKKGFCESVVVDIVPVPGIYTISGLQDWMHGLINGVDPIKVNRFREGRENIYLGRLIFSEEIGSDIPTRKVLKRRWVMRFYPDELIANLLSCDKDNYYILNRKFFEDRSVFS
jgi:hypothetical protein